jgi:RNA polymerase sigma factor FliA
MTKGIAARSAGEAKRDTRARDRLVLMFAPNVKYVVFLRIRDIAARCEVEDFRAGRRLIRSIDGYAPDDSKTLDQYAWT